MMKNFIFLALTGLLISCSASNKSSALQREEELHITRKYIGTYLDYSYTAPHFTDGHDLIWIRTTVYTTFGEISAYGKKCDFSYGDKIYLKPLRSTPGNFGNWEYQIENDDSVSYKVSDFRYENNVFVRSRDL